MLTTKSGNLGNALEQAYTHLALLQAKRAQAEAAIQSLERWAAGRPADATAQSVPISAAAWLLDVTTERLYRSRPITRGPMRTVPLRSQ